MTSASVAHHQPPDWVGPALGAAATAVTGVLGFLGVRFAAKKNPQIDPQDAINEGFQSLLDQMRKELVAASRERNHLNRVLEEERRTWRAEREAWRVEREAFMGEIAQLQAVAQGFERLLRNSGVQLPERKVYGPTAAVQIVDATLRQDGDVDE